MVGVVYSAPGTPRDALEAVAREFSPRIEIHQAPVPDDGIVPVPGPEMVLDLQGLARLFGNARAIADELRRTAADRGLRVRVAIAGTSTAARLLAHHRAGVTVIEPGTEADAVAPLPIALLDVLGDADASGRSIAGSISPVPTLRAWGLRTLGEFAALPPDEVAARLGQDGVGWQRRARGEDPRPVVPAVPEERFEQALDLEWPIEGLEPLSFVLGRLLEPLSAHLERRDRGAAILHVRLHLTTKTVHARMLQLPAPMRDARTLRTLALLDLESHPPDAPIDRVVVAVEPTPGRVVQFSLLTRALPSPEQVSTLLARLNALMGEGRCGSPATVDTWEPGAFAMAPFAPRDPDVTGGTQRPGRSHVPALRSPSADDASPVIALRRFRLPIPARVRVEDGRPAAVTIDRRGFSGGRVAFAAGPWRTSGAWWRDSSWDRDEWDIAIADGTTYRLFRERDTQRWFADGIVD